MYFNSLEFGFFLAVVFALYLALPHRSQNRMLLFASYVFYAAWDWRFLGLILLSTTIDYAVGRALFSSSAPLRRRQLVVLSVASNLAILGFFKYAGFFGESLQDLLGLFGVEIPAFGLQIVLPVGISFYTFQSLSYTLDIYRGRLEPTRSFLDFALFVSFFPQLVAGPIERASRLLPQIAERRTVTWEGVGCGSWLILWGIFKKAVVADNLGFLVDAVYAPESTPTGVEVLMATYAFALQIYCDFSGYTDVARGVAKLFGIELMLNFNLPYFAANPREFWQRWHISLSTWLRDYLYISLGGNRGGRARTYRNLALTMLLGGLWHGAAWTFVLWGAFHGALLIAHRAALPTLERLSPAGAPARGAWRALRVLVMFHFTCLGWLIFRAESLPEVGSLLGAIFFQFRPGLAGDWLLPFACLTLPLLAMQVWQALRGDLEVVLRAPLLVRAVIYAAIFLTIVLIGEDFGEPFIYFQF